MKRSLVIVGGIIGLFTLAFVAGRLTGHPGTESSTSPRKVLYYVDPMHPAYRSSKPGIAPDCGMALVAVYEGEADVPHKTLQAGDVELSPERQRLIGIRVAVARSSGGTRMTRTNGRVAPDENHLYRIQAGLDGWVESLNENPPGTLVRKDQVLATLYGPDIRAAESAYVGFISGVERMKANLAPENLKSIEDSGRINEEQLRLLGMGDKQIKELAASHRATSSLDLVSPGDGVVLSRGISPKQRFEKSAELYRIADLSKVWIIADVHGDDGVMRPGTRVTINVPQLGKAIKATMSTATPLFDEASRTLKLRLEADNPGLLLRPDMFVDVEFESNAPAGLSIPAEAVLDSGLRKIVYVETSEGIFEPRPVQISGAYGDRVTIASGIAEGDRIVVAGNFLLDSESRMRSAGQPGQTTKSEINPAPQPVAGLVMHAKGARASSAVEEHDPVCGMTLKAGEAAFHEIYQGKAYSFCSQSCRKDFLANPAKYASAMIATKSMAQDQAARRHD